VKAIVAAMVEVGAIVELGTIVEEAETGTSFVVTPVIKEHDDCVLFTNSLYV
jgi:hypothetical protein